MFELTNYKIVWLLCDIEYSITTYILMIAVYLCIHSVPQSEMKLSKIFVIYPLNTLTNRSIDWKEPRHVLCCDTVAAATAAPYNNNNNNNNSNTSNYRIISSQQYTNWSIKYPPLRSLCINHAIRNIYMARSHTHTHISLTYSYTQNAGSSMACIHPPFNLTSAIAAIPITHASCPLRRAVPKAHGIFHSAENVYEQHTIHIRGMAFPLPLLYYFFFFYCVLPCCLIFIFKSTPIRINYLE